MALPRDYAGQVCSLARALEIVGERWTLLIMRDALYGVRRFSDFVAHLEIPRAVLTERLATLVDEGVLARVHGSRGRDEYEITPKGMALWPVLRALTAWGDEYYAPRGRRRVFVHADDDGLLDDHGACARCGSVVDVADTVVVPGPGLIPEEDRTDPITTALHSPHRLVQPLAPVRE